jgi:hypothetical protein
MLVLFGILLQAALCLAENTNNVVVELIKDIVLLVNQSIVRVNHDRGVVDYYIDRTALKSQNPQGFFGYCDREEEIQMSYHTYSKFTDTDSETAGLFADIQHMCQSYLWKTEIYFFQQVPVGEDYHKMLEKWGHGALINSVLIRQKISSVNDSSDAFQSYKSWQMNSTFGFLTPVFGHESVSHSDYDQYLFTYDGGNLIINQDLYSETVDISDFNTDVKQNQYPLVSFSLSISIELHSASKHVPTFDFWVQPDSMQSILGSKRSTESPEARTGNPTPNDDNSSLEKGLYFGIPIIVVILLLIAYIIYLKRKHRLEDESKSKEFDQDESLSRKSLINSSSTITTLYSSSKPSHPQKYFRYSQDSASSKDESVH